MNFKILKESQSGPRHNSHDSCFQMEVKIVFQRRYSRLLTNNKTGATSASWKSYLKSALLISHYLGPTFAFCHTNKREGWCTVTKNYNHLESIKWNSQQPSPDWQEHFTVETLLHGNCPIVKTQNIGLLYIVCILVSHCSLTLGDLCSLRKETSLLVGVSYICLLFAKPMI